VTWGFNGIKPWFFHVMVEPTEVLVELKQVNKNNLNNQNKFMFFICNYLLLCVIICVYVLSLSLSLLLLFKCIHIFICFHIFLFLVCFSMLSYSLLFFGTWCGEHTSGEGASSHKWTHKSKNN
jgi:hypothetical protein